MIPFSYYPFVNFYNNNNNNDNIIHIIVHDVVGLIIKRRFI